MNVHVWLWVGVLGIVPVAVYGWLLFAYQFRPAMWNTAAGVGYIIAACAWGPLFVLNFGSIRFGRLYTILTTNMFLIYLYALVWVFIFERFVEPPDGIKPIPYRWGDRYAYALLGDEFEPNR